MMYTLDCQRFKRKFIVNLVNYLNLCILGRHELVQLLDVTCLNTVLYCTVLYCNHIGAQNNCKLFLDLLVTANVKKNQH